MMDTARCGCKVISVSNQKGGVGKTVTCVNLGIGLTREGKKVLMIDADPQGSLSISLGVQEPDKLSYSLATVMMMTSIDELLCVPDTEGTIDIDVEAIYPFENHPFKVIDDGRMEELTESIRISGVLIPVLVRPDDEGTYEMISGHRRLRAAKRAGLRKIPAIIKEMTDDEATIAMVDGNIQREEILPSEKAFAFKMKLDDIKRQGKSSDLTSAHNERRLEAADIVGEESGCSHAQVRRYVRLTELIPKLLDMVDEKRLALAMAVDLSYFNCNVQQWLYEYIKENGMIKQEQIMELRQYREDKNMTQEQLIGILVKSRSTTDKRKKITITERKLNKYFPAYYSQTEIERVIVGLLEQWKAE